MHPEPMASNLLREFEDFAKTLSPKGLANNVADRCIQYIRGLFSDSSIPIGPVLATLQGLRPAVVPPGVAAAWPSMNESRKGAYLTWIAALPGDKKIVHQIDLSVLLLDIDPRTSLNLLETLKPHKEVKERIAKTFLNGKVRIAALTTCEDSFPRVRKALHLLLLSSNGAPSSAKWAVVHQTLEYGVQQKMQSDPIYAPLLELASKELDSMQPEHREAARQLLGRLDPHLYVRFFPSNTLPSGDAKGLEEITDGKPQQSAPQILASESTPPVESRPALDKPAANASLSDSSQSLEQWISTLRDQISVLENARKSIADLEHERDNLNARLHRAASYEDGAHKLSAENESLKSRLAELETARHSIEVQFSAHQKQNESVAARCQSLEGDLRNLQATLSSERSEWQHRVQANANARVEEFRNSLASSLQVLLARVPPSGSPVDSELGSVLLLRLHQMIDTLERKGLRIRSSEGPQP